MTTQTLAARPQSTYSFSLPRALSPAELSATPRMWETWPAWANIVLAIALMLAPLWTTGAAAAWFTGLGTALGLAALWSLSSRSSVRSELPVIAIGAVVFLAPWVGGFSASVGAAWTAWIVAVLAVSFGTSSLLHRNTAN